MKNNELSLPFSGLWTTGFFLILLLPILAIAPWFTPPEWGKALVFRIIFSLLLFLLAWTAVKHSFFLKESITRLKAQKGLLWMLFGLILLIIASTMFSSDIQFSLWASPHRSGGAINLITTILFSLLLFLTVKRDHDWQRLFDFSFVISNLVVLFGVIQYFGLFPNIFVPYQGRPPSTLSNPILLGTYLVLLLFPLLSFAIKTRSKKAIFYWISFALCLVGIFISGSRAAYLGVIVGGLYFFFLYPKKMVKAKLWLLFIVVIVGLGILYISFAPSLPGFIQNNGRLSLIAHRLSAQSILEALGQTRFSAWKTFSNAVENKPLLGFGAENQSIAFDKYYDPHLNYLVKLGEDWWDRAHNIFLDLAISFGIPFLLLYFGFFGYLFFKLQKNKQIQPDRRLASHALQAAFLAYFTALLFGFDSVTTLLIAFFLVGYALYLITPLQEMETGESKLQMFLFKRGNIVLGLLGILLVWFLWEGALSPLYVNAQINIAESSACSTKLSIMDNQLASKSIIDSYVRLSYVEDVKGCGSYIANNEETYITKAIAALKEETVLQPLYTRGWILLTQLNNTLIAMETDPAKKATLESESQRYIDKAKQISPKRQEIYAAEAEIYFAAGDLPKMQQVATDCIQIDSHAGGCYWYLGLSKIMQNNAAQGSKDVETARNNGYDYDNEVSWSQLAVAYTQAKSYADLVPVYSRLLELDPQNLDFRATLASVYKALGQYDKAKQEALKILQLNPAAKADVDAFLATLPH